MVVMVLTINSVTAAPVLLAPATISAIFVLMAAFSWSMLADDALAAAPKAAMVADSAVLKPPLSGASSPAMTRMSPVSAWACWLMCPDCAASCR
ncbi:hypothetical protein D3C72_1596330 [compost metagenome]